MITEKRRSAISKALKGNLKLKESMKVVHQRRIASGEDALIRDKIKKTRIANGDWTIKEKSAWIKYCNEVRNITSKQPILLLPNFEKRGRGIDKFHLDHIVSKKVGFDLKLPSWFIGDIKNLRFISEHDNCSKQHYSDEQDILDLWFGLTESFDI